MGDGTSDPVGLAVGANDTVLTADSGEASGTKWAAAAGGGSTAWQETETTTAGACVSTGSLGGQAYYCVCSGNGDVETIDPRIKINARTSGYEYVINGDDDETGSATSAIALAVDMNPSGGIGCQFVVFLADNDAGGKQIFVIGTGGDADD